MSGFLKLPTELACEIVGKWLCLKDVVRLDSAFCHKETRKVLHESIFQSPLCIVAIADPLFHMAHAILTWVLMKCIRLSTFHVTIGVEIDKCEEYLKRFGDTVHVVAFRHCRGDYAMLPTLVAHHCSNLRVLVAFYCDWSPCVDILKSCVWLRSIEIASNTSSTHLVTSIPATHHLHISSIKLNCCSREKEVILGMCDPLFVQHLQLAGMTHIDWHPYVNLRSFGFHYDSFIHDANLLVQICTWCPWIVNLAVSGSTPTDEMVVPAVQALTHVRTFSCEHQVELTDHVLHALIEHHKHTLEAVYVYDCNSVSEIAINRLLKECVKLHTMSCGAWDDIDYSLMSGTLIIDFPNAEVWNKVQQHCHSLQCLQLVPPLFGTAVYSHIIVDAGNLQALRTVYTTREYVHDLRLQLPAVCVVEEEVGLWYNLFK